MNYFDLMIRKEIVLTKIVSKTIDFITLFRFRENRICKQSLINARKNKIYTNACIILNAPSVNKQDLNLLRGMDLVFVNRGFMHKQYKELHPKFHIICDPKFKNGIWPITWIDDILLMVPDITFCFPIEWYNLDKFKNLKERNIKICWIRIKDKPFTPFVAGYSLQFLMNMGYRKIYFTGCEANGLGHELVKDVSHFYGTNEENSIKGTKEYIMDFYMYMLNYSYFRRLAEKAKNKGFNIYNLTLGGCLDMFERKNINNLG